MRLEEQLWVTDGMPVGLPYHKGLSRSGVELIPKDSRPLAFWLGSTECAILWAGGKLERERVSRWKYILGADSFS